MCNLNCMFRPVRLVCSVPRCHFVDILIVTCQETADEDPPRANPAAMPHIKTFALNIVRSSLHE